MFGQYISLVIGARGRSHNALALRPDGTINLSAVVPLGSRSVFLPPDLGSFSFSAFSLLGYMDRGCICLRFWASDWG